MTDFVMVQLKSFTTIDGKLRTANEGPIEVSAEWAAAAKENGLLDGDIEVVTPADLAAEADAAAAAEADPKAKADKK